MASKISFTIIVVMLLCGSLFAQQDYLTFPAPQYMLPLYDNYTKNYLNAEAMGRGFTSAAIRGKVENAVNNPATLVKDKSFLYMELVIKPPIREFNEEQEQMYTSPVPFGLFGWSGTLFKDYRFAVSYNVPKSIVYDNFTIETMQGNDYVTRYPSYNLHQFTTTIAGNWGNLCLGLNLHQQLHQLEDVTVFYAFDRIDKILYASRVQPGILLGLAQVDVGMSLTLETPISADLKYVQYDTVLPMELSTGLSYRWGNNVFSADFDWEQCSSMDSKFNDKTTFKAGFEKRIRNTTYRIGAMHSTSVYSGKYLLPALENPTDEQHMWWDSSSREGTIKDKEQMLATGGFTYHFKSGKLVLGIMQNVSSTAPTTHFAMSLGFDLETLKGKKFLIFDK